MSGAPPTTAAARPGRYARSTLTVLDLNVRDAYYSPLGRPCRLKPVALREQGAWHGWFTFEYLDEAPRPGATERESFCLSPQNISLMRRRA